MYTYNGLCDVCGFKFLASQLRKRWDGFMVCDDDWEPRNILDFYRTRNDAHLLPFTRPDDTGEHTWTPIISNILNSYTVNATYIISDDNLVSYKIVITPVSPTVSGSGVIISLPIGSVGTSKGGTARTSSGKFLGSVTQSLSIEVPAFSISLNPLETLMISGQYIKG